MADDIIQETAVDPQVAAKAELDQLMARNLGTEMPEPVVQEMPADVVVEAVADVPEFKFDTFKEKFGYEKPEDIAAEIESLRLFKATPQTAAEIKFENDQSKLLFEALKAGKTDEVRAYLVEQERLERISGTEVNDQTAEDIIKAGFSLKYKELTPQQIDYKFNRAFGFPKEPIQRPDEDVEDFDARKSDWQEQVSNIKMERQIEAKIVKPDINNAKAKLVIPEIAQTVDQDYLDWKTEQEQAKTTNAQVFEAYRAFRQEDTKYEQDFNDEANKIAFKMEYTPSVESFKKAQECVTDLDKFFDMYKNSDGSPNRQKFISDIAYIIDRKSYTAEAMKQAKNAALKSILPDNNAGDVTRQLVTPEVEESWVDKQMRLAGVKR